MGFFSPCVALLNVAISSFAFYAFQTMMQIFLSLVDPTKELFPVSGSGEISCSDQQTDKWVLASVESYTSQRKLDIILSAVWLPVTLITY